MYHFPAVMKMFDIAIAEFSKNESLYHDDLIDFKATKQRIILKQATFNDIERVRYLYEKIFDQRSFTEKDRKDIEREIKQIRDNLPNKA